MNRRKFVHVAVAGTAAATLGAHTSTVRPAWSSRVGAVPTRSGAPPFTKAVMYGMVQVDLPMREKFALLKEVGFDGVELNSPNEYDDEEVLDAIGSTGLAVHGVVNSVHWQKTLSDPDTSVREEAVDALRTALRDANTYGASTVLLVPAVVTADVPYDEAYRRSQAEIRKAIPDAARQGVRIAIENVWNQFLLSPLEFARYVDEFESEWVGAYFDVGNVVTFGWPEHWIRVLGARILKLHIKEYSRAVRDTQGPSAGFRVPLGEGDVDWSAVRQALEDVGFSGWATGEVAGGGRERLREISERMDRVLGLA